MEADKFAPVPGFDHIAAAGKYGDHVYGLTESGEVWLYSQWCDEKGKYRWRWGRLSEEKPQGGSMAWVVKQVCPKCSTEKKVAWFATKDAAKEYVRDRADLRMEEE